MNKYTIIILLFALAVFPIRGLCYDIKPCYIADGEKHRCNQKTLKCILEREIASQGALIPPIEQAKYLSSRISLIAKALLQEGFFAEAYAIPDFDQNSILSFKSFTLWEGKNDSKRSIPLTFFIYAWPSQEVALKYLPSNSENNNYASPIHSHPMPCAFAVLHGTLFQKNYVQDLRYPNDRIACFINEEAFKAPEGDVDTLGKPFIHMLHCKKSPSNICLSLHAYGLATAQKVKDCYIEFSSECTFRERGL